MAYKQPYNSPNLKIGKERTMKVRIKPGKEGELSNYAMDRITKTNKRGKVTIEVPKSEMNLSKSKLFKTSKPKWTSNPNADPPSSRSTAKGFKKQRNKDRILKAAAGLIIAKGSGILRVDPPEEELSKKGKRKAKNNTVEVTGVEDKEVTGVKEKKPFKGYSKRELKNPNAPKNNNKNSCGKSGLFNTKFGGCFDGGMSAYR
jgi:hypothetical protein